MNKLLENVLEAHGGLRRWNEFKTVSAQIVSGSGLWALKGLQIQDLAPRQMTASLHEEFASVAPIGQPDWRSNSSRPGVWRSRRRLVTSSRERRNPRESFSGHTMNTPWDALHRAYFNGYAMWMYLTTSFLMATPGFEVSEIASRWSKAASSGADCA